MNLLTVAPISEGLPTDYLSYFSKEKISCGDLVEIQIKRRNYSAIVVEVKDLAEEKQNIKNASFGLKKISRVIHKNFIPPKIWGSLYYSASYNLKPIGQIIYDLIPDKTIPLFESFKEPEKTKGFELLLLQNSYTDRITRYKTTIRESFAKMQSIVIFFPTIIDIENAYENLSKGIDDFSVIIHSGVSEKQLKKNIDKLKNGEHPLLILSTYSLIPFIRKDVGLMVIEREHSTYYFTYGNDNYDTRFVLERLAHNLNIPCVLGSQTLSLTAHLKYKRKDAIEIMPIHYRNDCPLEIVSMADEGKSGSPYLSRKALSVLHNAKLENKGHIFLYTHRKGMYPTTICSDCGTLFVCQKCDKPYVLHKIGGVRTYVCHKCENIISLKEDTSLTCRHCGGWRMQTLGIATGGVEEELNRLGIPIFVIDGEHTNTKAKVKKVYTKWRESPYGVLIGTEMAHNVIQEADNIIVMSLDSLFSLPEYRTDEKILNLISEMGEKISGTGKIIFQTRMSHSPIVKYLSSHSFVDFYKEELSQRDKFLLPPYYVVIKTSFENLSEEKRERMKQELEPYVVDWFEAGRGITLLFIHIKETEWANNEILRMRIKKIIYEGDSKVNPLHFFI